MKGKRQRSKKHCKTQTTSDKSMFFHHLQQHHLVLPALLVLSNLQGWLCKLPTITHICAQYTF